MLRILSSKRYWSLIGKIADDQETIKGQANVINFQKTQLEEKQKSIEYLNEKLMERNKEIIRLANKLHAHGIQCSDSGIDYPATQKLYSDTDVNKILKI